MKRFLKHKFFSQEDGLAVMEYAILLPMIVLLLVGSIDLGLFMLKRNAAERMLNIASNAIQKDVTITDQEVQRQGSSVLIEFPRDGYICAHSWKRQIQAHKWAEYCGRGRWDTVLRPPSDKTYYVAIKVFVKYRPILLHEILPINFTMTAVVPVSPTQEPPQCDDSGEYLQWDGDKWICAENDDDDVERRWYGSQGDLHYSGPNPGCRSVNDHAICPYGGVVAGYDLCFTGGSPVYKVAVLCEFEDDD